MFPFVVTALAFWITSASPVYGGAEEAIGQVFTEDGAWCWFQDPRAVFVEGAHARTYAQWMTHDGKLRIGAYDHATGKVEAFTLKENWDRDDHNVGAFLVLPDKRLMVFYARHSKQGIFWRTTSTPEDITRWEDEVTVSDTPRITYAHPVYLSAEKKFYLFWRGPTWKPTFSSSDNGKSWRAPKVLIRGQSSIHFAFTDGHPRDEDQNSVYYLRYTGGKFFKADGSLAGTLDTLPIQHGKSDRVYSGRKTHVRAWVWDIALDDQEYPVIAYTRLPAETDHRYCYARWTGKKWLDVEITPRGKWFPQTPEGKLESEPHYSGGMAIDHSDPSTLYVSRPIKGVFEIEKWSTPDKGKTWRSRLITRDSKQINVRPVVPRGYDGNGDYVLWMSGVYEHYTNYRTGIRLLYPQN